MNRVQSEEPDPILDVPDEECQEYGKVHITEPQGHRNGDDNLQTGPQVGQPALGYKRQYIAYKKNKNQDAAYDTLIGGGGTEYKVKRQDVEDDPYIRAKTGVALQYLMPLLHVVLLP